MRGDRRPRDFYRRQADTTRRRESNWSNGPLPAVDRVNRRLAEANFCSFFVSNLPTGWGFLKLKAEFQKIEEVKDLFVATKVDKHGFRFGFLRFDCKIDVKGTETKLRKLKLEGEQLYVRIAQFDRSGSRINPQPVQQPRPMLWSRLDIPTAMVNSDVSFVEKVQGKQAKVPVTPPGVKQHQQTVSINDVTAKTPPPAPQEEPEPTQPQYSEHQTEPSEEEEDDFFSKPWMEIKSKDFSDFCVPLENKMVGKVRNLHSLKHIRNVLIGEGFGDKIVDYIGGFWVLLSFKQPEDLERFIADEKINSWFERFCKWTSSFSNTERIVWLEFDGLPLQLYCKEFLTKLAKLYGEVLKVEGCHRGGMNITTGRVCIKTAIQINICATIPISIDEIMVNIRGRESTFNPWQTDQEEDGKAVQNEVEEGEIDDTEDEDYEEETEEESESDDFYAESESLFNGGEYEEAEIESKLCPDGQSGPEKFSVSGNIPNTPTSNHTGQQLQREDFNEDDIESNLSNKDQNGEKNVQTTEYNLNHNDKEGEVKGDSVTMDDLEVQNQKGKTVSVQTDSDTLSETAMGVELEEQEEDSTQYGQSEPCSASGENCPRINKLDAVIENCPFSKLSNKRGKTVMEVSSGSPVEHSTDRGFQVQNDLQAETLEQVSKGKVVNIPGDDQKSGGILDDCCSESKGDIILQNTNRGQVENNSEGVAVTTNMKGNFVSNVLPQHTEPEKVEADFEKSQKDIFSSTDPENSEPPGKGNIGQKGNGSATKTVGDNTEVGYSVLSGDTSFQKRVEQVDYSGSSVANTEDCNSVPTGKEEVRSDNIVDGIDSPSAAIIITSVPREKELVSGDNQVIQEVVKRRVGTVPNKKRNGRYRDPISSPRRTRSSSRKLQPSETSAEKGDGYGEGYPELKESVRLLRRKDRESKGLKISYPRRNYVQMDGKEGRAEDFDLEEIGRLCGFTKQK